MTKIKSLTLVFLFIIGVAGFSIPYHAYAASCDAILGNWTWFTGGVATINPDGTAVYANPDGTIVNDGTWECTEASQGMFILKWRIGGYVNSLALSADGRGLSSTDPSQSFVTATRIGAGATTDATAHFDKGVDYLDKKMWDEAIAEFTKAIETNTGHVGAHINRGIAYDEKHQRDLAIADYTKALELDSSNEVAHFNRGNAHYDEGQYDQAISDYTRALEIDPKLTATYNNRGNAYAARGLHDQAISDFNRAIEFNPKDGIAYLNRGNSYADKGEYENALTDVIKGQELGQQVKPQRLDELRMATQAIKQSEKVTPEDSQEIARLVDRISNNYKDTLSIELLGFFDDEDKVGSAGRGLSVMHGEGFKLVMRYLHCRFRAKDYRTPRDAVEDCDKRRNGREWTEKTSTPIPFSQIQPLSIKLAERDEDFIGSDALSFGYEGYDPENALGLDDEGKPFFNDAPGPMRIDCKDRSACEQMAADLKKLVEIARKYASPKTSSSLEPSPKAAEDPRQARGNDSQEMSGLVERLNENYRRDKPEFHWPDGSIFDDAHIRKGHAVALEKDLTLVERYLECSIPEPNWRFGDNARIPADYRMSDDSVADCDKNRHGLKWEEKTVRRPLAEIDPSSIGLPKTGKADSGSDLRLTFGYEDDKFATGSISCKNRGACEQVGSELKRLIEIAQKSAAPKTTASLEPNTKNAEEPRHAQGGDAQEVASLATAKVDPALVGMWKLAHPGLDMYWQIRADGAYRYFGVNARPFEHWGTIEASGGRWATQWAGGQDGGSYTLSGNTWQETGKAGTGNWQRIWKPGDGGSQGQCPLIDPAEVEALFGNATHGRAAATNCSLTASGVGYADSLNISVIDNASERFVNVRKDTSKMRPVIDVPGLGDTAFIDADSLHVLKGNRYAVITVKMYPDHPDAVSNAALISLGRSVTGRF